MLYGPRRHNLTPAQDRALEDVSDYLRGREITFEVAVECRDLIRDGRLDEAYAVLAAGRWRLKLERRKRKQEATH